jgi:Tol biopolymer transport system component
MKKQLLMIGITLILLTIGLSGCETNQNENQSNGSQDEVEFEGKLVFSSEYKNKMPGYIHIINVDGTNEIILPKEGGLYVWSPDGNKIAYYQMDGIYVVNSDGTGEIQIVNSSAHNYSGFSWSPDGKILLTETGLNGGIYIVNADGSNLIKLTGGEDCYDAIFTPDGMKIIYQSPAEGYDYRIYIMNYDGTDKTMIYEGERTKTIMCSPDGLKISYLLYNSYDSPLYVMNYDGSNKITLAENVWWPSWSLDGTKIAYSQRNRFGNDPASLYISNPDGTGKVALLEDVAETYHLYLPHSWSPDGKKIVYNLDENIYIINIDGSNQKQLAVGFYPQWSSR